MRESTYQNKLIKKLEDMFPGCFILINDPRRTQGLPDILILFKNMWGFLEVKMSEKSSKRPNQDYYVDRFKNMSFASFINPDNEGEVLGELQRSFGAARETRVPQS